MKSEGDQQRAVHLSDYADSLIVHRRKDEDDRNAVSATSDRELPELAKLVELLASVRVEPPAGAEIAVARRVEQLDPQSQSEGFASRTARWRDWWRQQCQRAAHALPRASAKPVAIAAVNVVLIVMLFAIIRSPSASAAAILARTDAALVSLVQPGKVLFRRWRIVDRIRDEPGAPERIAHRFLLEYVDGSDIRHATGKSTSLLGRTYLAYASTLEEGRLTRRTYYEPGYANEPKGLLSIVPGSEEFDEALARFTGRERRILETYLARGYIYEPLVSELQFNQGMLRDSIGIEPLPRVRLSVESAMLGGQPVYKVRASDDVRFQFRWRRSGPPAIWLERQETVRYISKETYLAVRSEESHLDETGARIETTRELVESTYLVPTGEGDDPFALDVPADTPIRRQSAYEHLVQVLRALERAPRFLSQIH